MELDRIRALHPKAAHVCWAYIAGPPGTTDKGMSDDGEPRGTAGRPLLTLLEHSEYGEIWAAVARYFGGIKLGKGGLVRAYTSSLQQTLSLVHGKTSQTLLHCRLVLDYNLLPVVERLCTTRGVEITEKRFSGTITMDLLVPETGCAELQRSITRLSKGTAVFSRIK